MTFDPQIHKRRSIRLQGYDYSGSGLYFVTICTHTRACLFGQIVAGKMILNENGYWTEKCWLEIPLHFPNAILHEHIVMPNHIHGIIELTDNNNVNDDDDDVGVENFGNDIFGCTKINTYLCVTNKENEHRI